VSFLNAQNVCGKGPDELRTLLEGLDPRQKLMLSIQSAVRSLGRCVEAGKKAPPLSSLAASSFAALPDRFSLTKPNTACTIAYASVTTLRGCSGSSRNTVRLHLETAFGFAGIPGVILQLAPSRLNTLAAHSISTVTNTCAQRRRLRCLDGRASRLIRLSRLQIYLRR
jgi:hypothetical protein